MRIRIRRILIPVFYCLAIACLIEVPLGQTDLFGEAVILWDTLFRAILAVPVLYYFYQEDAVFRGEKRWDLRAFFLSFGAGAGLSALSFFLMRAAGVSAMEEAGKTLFTGELWLQLLVLLIASPLLEEFFFRGVLYGRLKELLSGVFRPVSWEPDPGDLRLLYGLVPFGGDGAMPDGKGAGHHAFGG